MSTKKLCRSCIEGAHPHDSWSLAEIIERGITPTGCPDCPCTWRSPDFADADAAPSDALTRVIAAALKEQGAAYPNAGAAHVVRMIEKVEDLAVVELPEGIYADGVWVALDGSGSISGIEGPAHGLVMSAAKMLAAARAVDEAARS